MARTWVDVPVTLGCVTTRDPGSLEVGELQSASNVRLRQGDKIQLHPERLFEEMPFGTIPGNVIDTFYINFEDQSEYIIAVSVWGGTTFIYASDLNTTSPWAEIGFRTGVATRAGIVYYGNIWILGTDIYNWVISTGLEVRQLGLSQFYELSDQPPLDYFGYQELANATWVDHPGAPWSFVRATHALVTPAGDAEIRYLSFAYDRVFYTITRYDSINDIESAPLFFYHVRMDGGIADRPFTVFGFQPTQTYPIERTVRLGWNTWEQRPGIKYRIYRYYAGKTALDSDAFTVNNNLLHPADLGLVTSVVQDEVLSLLNGDQDYIGFLVDEVDPFSGPGGAGAGAETGLTVWTDYGISKANVGQPLPFVDFSAQGGLFRAPLLRQPRPFVQGTVWSEVLIVAEGRGQILPYSPRGVLEQQPDVYKLVVGPTKRSDQIVQFNVVNDRLLVLTTGSLHQINFLLQEGSPISGPEQSVVSSRHGGTGFKCAVTISTEAGELLLWLSRQGLMMSDGSGWRDACIDWSRETALPANALVEESILVNDTRDYRVLCFTPLPNGTTIMWAFYYHPSHRKYDGSSLIAMGPTILPYHVMAATAGSLNGEDTVFMLVKDGSTAQAARIIRITEELSPALGQIRTGYISGEDVIRKNFGRTGQPSFYLQPSQIMIKAKPLTEYAVVARVSGHPFGTDTEMHRDEWRTLEGLASSPTLRTIVEGVQSNNIEIDVAIAVAPGTEDKAWSVGPLWLSMDVNGGDID